MIDLHLSNRRMAPILAVLLMAASFTLLRAAPDDKARATAALEQDVKADPNNPQLWLHLGYAYRNDGQLDLAQSAFQKVINLDSRNAGALYMLALIYEKKHQTSDALAAWKKYQSVETDAEKRSVAEKHIHQLSQ